MAEKVKPTILTTVRFDQAGRQPAELFKAGEEDELLEYLDAIHGDGIEGEDGEVQVESKDAVLVRLTRKGYIANFIDGVEMDDDAAALNLDQQNERAWKRRQEAAEKGEVPVKRTRTKAAQAAKARAAAKGKGAAKTADTAE